LIEAQYISSIYYVLFAKFRLRPALGCEDLNDHDRLRRDPVHGLICGKRDPPGHDRILWKSIRSVFECNQDFDRSTIYSILLLRFILSVAFTATKEMRRMRAPNLDSTVSESEEKSNIVQTLVAAPTQEPELERK
jgi:hypothetical protein